MNTFTSCCQLSSSSPQVRLLPSIISKLLGFVLFVAALTGAHGQVVLTLSGTANSSTNPAYTVGNSYSFSFTLNSSYSGNASDSFSSGENVWVEAANGDDPIFSQISGSQLTGTLSSPSTPYSYVFLYGTNSMELIADTSQSPGENLGISAGAALVTGISFFGVINTLTFAFPGSYTDPLAYFTDYFGTYDVSSGTFSIGGSGAAAAFTVTAISIGTSAVPEPSTYAAIFGACALGFAAWRRRRSNSQSPAAAST